jgi:hypothetical protein
MSSPDDFARELRAALDLDQDERAYLSTLNLSAAWRSRSAVAKDSPWGWLALCGVIGAFVAWTLALQPFVSVLQTANLVGLSTIALDAGLSLLFVFGRALIDISINPALPFSQPLLALLALAVLFWPRIASAPHQLQGVRS